MKEDKSKGQSIALAVVALLAGVLIGITGASAFDLEDTAVTDVVQDDSAVSEAGTDLRVSMNRLLTEHAGLSAAALRNVFDDSDGAEASLAALEENGVELAAIIGSIHGDEVEEEFLDQWRAQIAYLVDYAAATTNGNRASLERAESDLAEHVESAAAILSSATGIPPQTLVDELDEYVDQLTGTLNSYAAGNYEESYRVQRDAVRHAGATADTLSQAIIERYPEKF